MKSVLYLAILAALVACSPSREVKERIAATDGAACAVVAEVQTDATVATPVEVYVTAACDDPKGDPIWRADKVEGLAVTWENPRVLKISAETSRVFVQKSEVSVVRNRKDIRIEVVYDIKSQS